MTILFRPLILNSLLLLFFAALAQKDSATAQLQTDIQSKTLRILDSIEYCSLITIDSIGQPRVRIMSPFPVDSTFTVWLGTHSKSRKVYQIRNNPKVTLSYFNVSTSEYVSIHGNAAIIETNSEKERLWKNEWKDFYPNRAEDYTLIKVIPYWVEVFSYSKGLISDESTLKPMSFYLNR